MSDIADQPDLHLEWQLEPGDVQLLYNWRVGWRSRLVGGAGQHGRGAAWVVRRAAPLTAHPRTAPAPCPRRNQLHMRTHYEDWPGFENRRHLLRLWLTADDAPPLDPAYYGAAAPGRPGLGIYRRGTVHSAPLDAE